MTLGRLLRDMALLALMVAWAVAAHYGSAGAGQLDLNAAIAVAPLALAVVLALARLGGRWAALGGGVAGALALAMLWPQLRQNVAFLYYLQHLGVHLALGVLFGGSLRGPGEALITRMARHIFNGQLTERNRRYTRQATVAWTLFFFGNALVSTGLFWLAPHAVWSVHANLLTGPLVALMFLAEHLWRMRVLPPEERPTIAAAVRAYRSGAGRQEPPATAS